jgi:guanylate kinase
VLVFILPPSGEVLLRRLNGRGSEDRDKLLVRMQNALAEIGDVWRYHYVVVNDELEQAIERVGSIIDAESVRHDRVHTLEQQVGALIAQLEQEITGIQRGD